MNKNGTKDFGGWITLKKSLHDNGKLRAIKDGDIWWCAVGENVGKEICGKGKTFARPVIVLRKLSKYNFIGVPMTSKSHNGSWYVHFTFHDKDQIAVVAQTENISVQRLYNKIGAASREDLEQIRKGACNLIVVYKKYSLILRLGWTGIPENALEVHCILTVQCNYIMTKLSGQEHYLTKGMSRSRAVAVR